jgi:oxygen-independent coproporphyrinogen-3 oxidase
MGIESLDEGVLQGIRRRHGRAEALDACSLLVESGRFVNVDLIYGLPGQSEDSFRGDLAAAADRGPSSFTLYNLRLNEFTPARSALGDLERMDLPRLVRWRAFVKQAASELGYEQTRWHTFVRRDVAASPYDRAPCVDGFGAGRQLGLGTSAASHLGHVVYRNDESLEGYMTRVERGESPVGGIFPLGDADRRTLFVARSLGDGGRLDPARYAAAFDSTLEDDFGPALDRLRGAGLLTESAAGLALSPEGELVYDLALLAFYPERARRWLDERQSGTRPSARKPLASAVTAA